jgi:hypothetical protein
MAYFIEFRDDCFSCNSDGIAIDFLIQKNMKTKSIIAGLVAAAAALTTYYIIKKRKQNKIEPIQRTHHLTEVFSKAKSSIK